jgi:hypothetical protein
VIKNATRYRRNRKLVTKSEILVMVGATKAYLMKVKLWWFVLSEKNIPNERI